MDLEENPIMYAIIKIGAGQFKAEKNQEINAPYLPDYKKGDTFEINDVALFKDDKDNVKIGTPYLSNVVVKAKLISHDKESKVIIQKFRKRKRSKKRTGHRQDFSKIRITDIVCK